MALPVSLPIEKSEYLLGAPNSYGFKPRVYELYRKWRRQTKPYDIPLDFDFYVRRAFAYRQFSDIGENAAYYEDVLGIPTYMDVPASTYNACYQKLRDAVTDRADLGVAFAEGKQSMEMITNRLLQLNEFSRHLRKGHIGLAAHALKTSVSSRKAKRLEGNSRKGAAGFADNYLEFHFGWSPLVSDIYSSAKALSNPIRPKPFRVSKRFSDVSLVPSDVTVGSDRTRSYLTESVYQTLTMRGFLSVVNPNLALADQLGLINPATILWEKVPFSFVVDWFVNVGDFLNSFTDFAGMQFIYPHRTVFTQWRQSFSSTTDYNINATYPWTPETPSGRYSGSRTYTKTLTSCRRTVGTFPGPTLAYVGPWTLSPRRGLAAASLLIQSIMPGSKRPSWAR